MTDLTFAVVGATSMHSSGMRTARLLIVSGGSASTGGSLPSPGGSASRGVCLIPGGLPNPGGGLHLGGGGGGSASPTNRMTHRRKKIILPQISFAGGNYTHGTEWVSDPTLAHLALSEPVLS